MYIDKIVAIARRSGKPSHIPMLWDKNIRQTAL